MAALSPGWKLFAPACLAAGSGASSLAGAVETLPAGTGDLRLSGLAQGVEPSRQISIRRWPSPRVCW